MANEEYAGDVLPAEVYAALQKDSRSVLIDVRTVPEWQFVGVPDLKPVGKDTYFIEWQSYPTMQVNAEFADLVKSKGVDADQTVYLICRSGVRSKAAAKALTASGFRTCYNVAQGFEGDADENGHRGRVGGWKFAGLPWRQQ